MRSVSTNYPGLINICSDSGEEFVTEQSYSEPIYPRFKIGGPPNNPTTAFIIEDTARLFAIIESEIREDSVIDNTGTDIERVMISTISKQTELPSYSPISFFESSGSDSGNLTINANVAIVPRNGRSLLTVPPMQAGRLRGNYPLNLMLTVVIILVMSK